MFLYIHAKMKISYISTKHFYVNYTGGVSKVDPSYISQIMSIVFTIKWGM